MKEKIKQINWKYVFFGVAALFALLIIFELLSNSKKEPETSTIQQKTSLTTEKPQEEVVVKVKPSKTDVSGPLHGYFEVVDRNYKIAGNKVNVELKRVKEGFPEPWTEGMELGYSDGHFETGFYIEVLDEDGDIEDKDETSISYDRTSLESLATLNLDETSIISFSVSTKKPVSFRIGSTFTVHEEKPETEENESDDDNNNNEVETPAATTPPPPTYSAPTPPATYSQEEEYDDNEPAPDYSDEDDDYYDDGESTWEKVKKKSKRIYRNTKRKFRRWLDK